MMTLQGHSKRGGYIALISVLMAGGVMLVLGLSASRSGITSAQSALRDISASQARLLADACAEDALFRLRANLSYAGNEEVSVNANESCTIRSISGVGPTNRQIRVEATVLGYVQKVELSVATVTPAIFVNTWRRVAEFSP